ncbi:MAG: tetratricopeptide repeat protein [Blastocatellia bacterium]
MMRFCISCGIELIDAAKFCRRCGAVIENLPQGRGAQTDPLKTQFEPTERLDEKPPVEAPQPARTEATARPRRAFKTIPMPPSIPTDAKPTRITGSVTGSAAARTPPSGSGKKWIALGAPAFLLIVLCGIFFSTNFRNSSAEPTTGAVATTPEVRGEAPAAEVPAETPSPVAAAPRPSIKPAASQERPTPAMAQPMPARPALDEAPPVQPAAQPANSAQPVKSASATPEVKAEKPAALTMQDHWRIGAGHLGAGRNQEALREFEQARRLAPGNIDIFYLIGTAYHQMGRYDEALEAYRKCTSGVYASVAQNHVKRLEKKGGKKEGKK